MDISNWGVDRILSLPDCCFGPRFLVAVSHHSTSSSTFWHLSEIALPEKFVIWEFYLITADRSTNVDYARLAIGDTLPTSSAEMDAHEPLFSGLGFVGFRPRRIHLSVPAPIFFRKLRQPVSAGGRRIILEVSTGGSTTTDVLMGIVVSSFPKDIPEWLFSALGKSL